MPLSNAPLCILDTVTTMILTGHFKETVCPLKAPAKNLEHHPRTHIKDARFLTQFQ